MISKTSKNESSALVGHIFPLVLMILINFNASSQFYPAKLYSVRDGMPTNAIYDITQSPDGILWFMTSKGVASYNSLDWKLFPDSLKLPNSPYSFIKSLEDGSVWVAGQNRDGFIIRYLKNEKWHSINIEDIGDIHGKFCFDVKIKKNDYVIAIGNHNYIDLITISTETVNRIRLSDFPSLEIYSISFKNDSTYISSSEGLFIYSDSIKPHPVNTALGTQKEVLQVAFEDESLYLLGKDWLGIYKNDTFQYLNKGTGVTTKSQFNKHNLTIDQFGRVFFSSMSSARFLDPSSGKSEILFVNGRIFNAKSNKIFVDDENNVWVGDHRGLFKFNVLRFQNYNENIGLANDEVAAISTYQNQLVLANKSDLNFLSDGVIKKKLPLNYKAGIRALDMAYDGQNTLYIAANSGGLQKYDGINLTNITLPENDNNNISTVEYIDKKLFFANTHALFSLEGEETRKEIDLSGIRNINYLNADSIALLSTGKGLYLYQPRSKKIKHFTSRSLNYQNTYNVCKWNGQYFVGTGGGLAIISDNEITPYFTTEKLNRVAVYSLFVSTNNKLWIGTNEGVFIWDEKKLINYNRSHGLIGDEINRNAFIQIKEEKVWIGTELGASVYDYSNDISLEIIPNLSITKASTLEGQILNESNNTLKYNNNTLEFQFIGISFFDENQIKYRYKLIGFDDQYLYINNPNSNAIRYTNLPPDDYQFLVESSIDSNHWSSPKSINFTIKKPFYTTYWFLIFVAFSLIVILYIIYKIRFNFILRNQKKLKKEVRQRTQEIQSMNDEIQAQNEELLSQSEEIATNNERLEEIVQDRTQKLQEQNERLSKYAFMNSHELRGPICRMIGLLNVLKLTKSEDREKILNLIQITGLELDAITIRINQTLETVDFNELYEFHSNENLNNEIESKKANN
ncbi:Y_Y_Y domain-containing protein [Marivirga sericea]|uniref:Y_Y_Y domain-containing protein n=1 Tax=Marivirga sericea TaxID=1028 RepID=A0A1X7ISX4_9BACT|nr:Y_Y_Y domain-containing protein [Marivirga sericea]